MNHSSESRIRQLFELALEKPPEERASFVKRLCGEGTEVCARVMELVRANAEVDDSFVEPSASSSPDPIPPAAPEAGEQAGEIIGNYKLLQPIGEGGMGEVWMAEQFEPVRRRVALKVIKLGMDSKQVVVRFEAERQALALMDHPGIAKVLDGGVTGNGRPYFVMELVKGVPITQFCDEARLGIAARLQLFRDVCAAVQHAHQKGIIHRDLKPSNVMVTLHDGKPVPKVIDFGIAKATNQQLTQKTLFTEYAQILGTPEYMAPEQASLSGLDVDTRADIYSLGVLLYELLTGTKPFDLKTLLTHGYEELLRTIREDDPPRPSTRASTTDDDTGRISISRQISEGQLGKALRGDLDWIVVKSMEKDRTRRYETANALADDIGRFLDDEPVMASPPSAAYRASKFIKRNRGPVTAAALVLIALVAGVIGTTWGLWTALQEKARAETAEEETAVELARATEVKGVIKDMISGISPEEALGADTVLLRRLVERTAGRLKRGEVEDARIAAELHGLLSDAYLLVGDYDKAAEHAQPAVRLSSGALHDRVRLAQVWHRRGEHGRARELVEELQPLLRAELGAEHERTIFLQYLYGSVLAAQMEFARSTPIAEETWETARRVLGEDHKTTRAARTLMSFTLGFSERSDEVLGISRELFDSAKRRHGENHPGTLRCMTNLSIAYWRDGENEQAVRYARESLARMETVFPDDHQDVLTTEQALAMSLLAQGQLEEAGTYFERVLDGARKTLDPEHFLVLEMQFGLSNVRSWQGRHVEAAQLAEDALEAGSAVLTEDSIRSIGVLEAGTKALLATEQFERALELAKRVVAWRERVLGAGHPLTLEASARLARAEGGCGNREEAARLVAEVWGQTQREEVGLELVAALEKDPERCRELIAQMLELVERKAVLLEQQYQIEYAGGEFELAAATAARWIVACETEFGPDAEVTLRARIGRAEALVWSGDEGVVQSIPLYRAGLERLVEVLGPDHRNVAVAKMGLGLALAKTGNLDEGVKRLHEARELSKRTTGDKLMLEFETARRLGEVYTEAERFSEADEELRRAIELHEQLRGSEPLQEVQRAGLVAMSMGDMPRAEQFFRKAIELSEPGEDVGVRARYALGLVLDRTGRPAEAEPWLSMAREGAREVMPESEILRTNTCDVLGFLYQRQRRFEEALDAWQEAAELSVESMEESNLSASTIRINVGHMHAALEQDEEAVASWERALLMMEEADVSDPEVRSARKRMQLQVYDRAGMTYWQLEQWERSAELLAAGLELKQELLGPTHRNTLGAMTNLGIALRESGEWIESIAVLEESVALKRKALPEGDPWFLNALASLVGAYDEVGDVEKGQPAAEELLGLLESAPDGMPKWLMMADTLLLEKLTETYDPIRAVALAQMAAERDRSWETLEILARAQFASGDESAGKQTLEKAIEMAPAESHERLRKIGE